MDYQPPLDDTPTIFSRVLEAPARLQTLECHARTDADLMRQVVGEAMAHCYGAIVQVAQAPYTMSINHK